MSDARHRLKRRHCPERSVEVLGWPGRWAGGRLYEDGGLPVHLYPFPVTKDGEGPCDRSDPDYDRDVCWCHFDGCVGLADELGFPVMEE